MQKNIIATGGREHRLKLYDLEKQAMIFNEKNLSHDWLELKIPISISDLNFLPGTQQIATVGRYGHVRITMLYKKPTAICYLPLQDALVKAYFLHKHI